MEKIIVEIAKKFFDVETLQTRNLDRLDFHEVSVGSMKAALDAAYKAGQDSNKVQMKT